MMVVFISALALLAYTYVGYPLAMRAMLWRHRARTPRRVGLEPGVLPAVTMIIAAHNEAAVITAKLENVLGLDYPQGRLEVIVVSDASSDRTDELVAGFAGRGVRLVRQEPRGGKLAAVRRGVGVASGEILVISDATSQLEPSGLRSMAGRFADPGIGAVSGRVIFRAPGDAPIGGGEKAYWSYNSGVLEAESELASLTSVSGTYFAVRSELFPQDVPRDLAEDLVVPLAVVARGLQVVLDPGAVCFESAVASDRQEIRKRSRITVQNIRGLTWGRALLNPFRHGRFAVFLISHKLLRVLSPVLLIVMGVANVLVWRRHWAMAAFGAGQAAFYLVGLLVGPLRLRRFGPLNAIHFFCLSNLAVAIGIVQFLGGHRAAVWDTGRG